MQKLTRFCPFYPGNAGLDAAHNHFIVLPYPYPRAMARTGHPR